jgi:hypothetical protein
MSWKEISDKGNAPDPVTTALANTLCLAPLGIMNTGSSVSDPLRSRRLLPITGKHFRGGEAELVAARLRNAPHGPIANLLWQYIADQTARLVPATA